MKQSDAASSMEVSIRVARVSDAADVANLTAQLGYEVEPPVLGARLSSILARRDHRFLVAEVDGCTAGWVHAAITEYVETDRFVVVAGLVVATNRRRQGIGRMLMRHAENWAREQGCSVVRLWSSSRRNAAHQFYEQLGYQNVKTQYSFVKCLDPARQDAVRGFVPRIS